MKFPNFLLNNLQEIFYIVRFASVYSQNTHCGVMKLADMPSRLGGGEFGINAA